jgi:hypothetical protein
MDTMIILQRNINGMENSLFTGFPVGIAGATSNMPLCYLTTGLR